MEKTGNSLIIPDTIKISFGVIIAFVFAITISFLFLNENFVDRTEVPIEQEKEFYEKNLNIDEKKIFLIGSSHIMSLNTTHIENYLNDNGYKYSVYNLAKGGDVPADRLPTLDLLIDANPEIVVYGIAERDFKSLVPLQQETDVPKSPFPNFALIFDEVLWNIFTKLNFNLEFLSNPKLTTLVWVFESMNSAFGIQDDEEKRQKDKAPFPKTPFFRIGEKEKEIRSDDEIKNIFENIYEFSEIPPPYKNPQSLALKEIINELKENEIKIIIYTTPHHKIFQDSVPEKVDKAFQEILDEITDKTETEIVQFYNKYNNLNVWNNPSHVAVNEKSLIFSEDIAKLILEKVGP